MAKSSRSASTPGPLVELTGAGGPRRLLGIEEGLINSLGIDSQGAPQGMPGDRAGCATATERLSVEPYPAQPERTESDMTDSRGRRFG